MTLSPATEWMRRRFAPAALVALVAVGGCATTPPPGSPSPSAAASPEPVALACAGRLNAQGIDVTTPAELEHAATFRRDMGLPSGDALVREMACRADVDLTEIPLTVEEVRELERRTRVGHEINEIVQPYGNRHQAEFGGLYIDQSRGGVVTILWTAHVPEHEAAIRALVDPDAPVAFRQVRWSEAELLELQGRISAEWDWFSLVQAAAQETSVNVQENVVEVGISSANPDAPRLITAHFAAPAGMIRVISDGTGAALLPWATVHGRVVTADGNAPGENSLVIQERPGGPPGSCGSNEGFTAVQPTGEFEHRCQVGIRILQVIDGGATPSPVLGESRVEVPADGVVFVEIVIDREPQP